MFAHAPVKQSTRGKTTKVPDHVLEHASSAADVDRAIHVRNVRCLRQWDRQC